MGRKSTSREGEEEAPPDHLRCSRTDGRQWRCRRRAMENLKLCEIHDLQGRIRQNKEKVPESLKLQRKRKMENDVVEEIRVKMRKKKKKMMMKNEKQCDIQLELIRMVLQREVEKKKKKNEELDYSEGELRKEFPNGVMAISPGSTSHDDYTNVGVEAVTPRFFRSKNVERVHVDNLKVVPYGGSLNKCKRRKCHWCQRSDSWNLVKCSSCLTEFFCMDCIKERYFDTQNEVKMACPVCRGTCTCKDCLASQYKDSESKEYLAGTSRVDRILHFHYLVCLLLPVVKQISKDQRTELETEAILRGKRISDIVIKQVEFGRNEKNYCNYCKTAILDLHRSCLSCSYSLCLSCCQALSQGSTSERIKSSLFELPGKIGSCIASESYHLDDKAITNGNLTDTSISPEWTSCDGTDSVSCPPRELGGCGDSHLDLRCVFPLSCIKEMEVKAEEIVCSYDFPETLDKSSSCSLCIDKDHKTNRYKQFQEAAQRKDSNDNFLFYPTVLDINSDHFEHFQKHWGKGHPVIVRDVLQSTPKLSWDPMVMFCSYLERSIARYENNTDLLETCLDWWEVEMNIRQYFSGSLKCQPRKNTWQEMLKLEGWLSSKLFKEHFPVHFAEVIDALPLQDYMNPMSGLLNLAAYLPPGSPKVDMGPYVYISYGCTDEEAYSVTNLCYGSYDVVNIMTNTTDVLLSTEQLAKISRLLKKHRALCRRKSSNITSEHAEDREREELQNIAREGADFFKRFNRTSCILTEAKSIASQSLSTNISGKRGCGSDSDTEKAQNSLPFHRTVQSTEMPPNHNSKNLFDHSNSDKRNKFTENSGAQWDVFRRQDVPKLLEYLKRHSDEFSHTNEYHKKMVHPILDQSFFLDNAHKMRLKEEFEIEPWTFEQHAGEAVIIPAGCPYQIRNPKSCVHVVLEFVSPENITECIQLINEVRLLPVDHKARVDKLEMKKMALHSMGTAIEEIRELTCKT